MVDKALFLGTSGAKSSMHQLTMITNNLANINTTGFRADYELMKTENVGGGDKQSTRVYSSADKSYSDFKHGPLLHTDRNLDVAIQKEGFIAVQTKEGKEAYTRAGDLQISNGFLTTQSGDLVLGTSGVVSVGQVEKIAIGDDGTISARVPGEHDLVAVNRIKLTNPPLSDLQKGPDGLFYLSGNATSSKQDDSIRLVTGSLEGSNVNPVTTLTSLIELSRSFEMHTNLMKTVESLATKANQILEAGR